MGIPAPDIRESILLIEDDPLFTELINAILEEGIYDCAHVSSGREAIVWLRSHNPRLVVTDYMLADMTAEELAAKVDLPPFIVTTGAGSEQVAVSMMKLGARDYLAKDAAFIEKLPKVVARVIHELEVEERLRAAERVAGETQEQLRLVLAGSQDGFWDLDLQHGVSFLSDRGWTILGVEPGAFALTHASLLGRVHPDDQAAALAAIEAHLGGKSAAIDLLVRVQDPAGDWKWVLLRGRAVAVDPQGPILRLAGTLADATERKRAEDSQLRDRKMESLGLMASGIAHDFNNLFQALTTNLELMGPRFAGDPKGRATLDRCFGILEKASVLSRRMLDYSGGSLRAQELIDLGALLRQEAASLAHQLRGMNPELEMVCTIEPDLPPVAGDPALLAQVLQILVHNGAESLPEGNGRLSVSLNSWDPGDSPFDAGGWVGDPQVEPGLCLEVRDSGRGICQEHRAKIFDPFFSTKAHGRGLGLSAALGIIRSHGGSIHFESALERGSVFRVLLPYAPEVEPEAPPTPQAGPARQRTPLILLVDDEEDLRVSLAEILTDILSFRVIEARDGVEAVERFLEHAEDISLVIMDVTMPRMSGIQAWEEIRKATPAARGILCSGYSEETGVQLASGHGFLGFLKKPFSLQALRESIQKALPETA